MSSGVDYPLGQTIHFLFTTRSFSTGAPAQLAGTPVLSVYEDDSTTQITSGVSLGVDHDTVTGLNLATVVATSGNGYESGKSYHVVITTGTVGGVSVVGEVVGNFTIERAAALRPTTAGRTLDIQATGEADVNVTLVGGASTNVSALATNVDAIKTKTDFLPSATAGAAGGVFIAGTNAATTITSSSGSALTLSSTGGNGHGLAASGNGTGYGVSATGGVSGGHGIYAIGSTTGSGIYSIGGSLSAGIYGQGGANGAGIQARGGSTSGAGFYAVGQTNSPGINASGQGSGNGFSIIAGATGIGLSVTGGSTSGDGFYVSATSGDGIDAVSAGGGVDIRGDITGNVTGNVSGSVASVTGGINTGAGTITTLDALDTAQDSQHTTTQDYLTNNLGANGAAATEAGGTGDHLSAIPWNASWDAEVQSEVDDALDTAISELTVAAPTATPTLRTGLMLLYMMARNKLVVQTSGTDAIEVYNDAGTKICSKLITDDGSDYTEAEMT